MKVLLTLWITAVLLQEVVPSALVRLPRHSDKRPQSTVHTEYIAKYEQKGSQGNGSFSTVKGKQEIVHENCGDSWNSFAEKCAGLIKNLIASLANAVSSHPGDATNLQLHIKNSFKHFDSTHNCSCFNHTCKGLSDIDLSSLFKNITVETSPLKSNCEDLSDNSDFENDKSGDAIDTLGDGKGAKKNHQLDTPDRQGLNVEDEDSETEPTNKSHRGTNNQHPGLGNSVNPTGSSADPLQGNYSPPPFPSVNHGRGSFPYSTVTPGPNQPPFEYSAVSESPPHNTRPPTITPYKHHALPVLPDVLPKYPSPPPVAKRKYAVPKSSSEPQSTNLNNSDSNTPQSGPSSRGQPLQNPLPPVIPSGANGQLEKPIAGQDSLYPELTASPYEQATQAPAKKPNHLSPPDSQYGQPNAENPDSSTPWPFLFSSLGPVDPSTQPEPNLKSSDAPNNDCEDDSDVTHSPTTSPGAPLTKEGNLPNSVNPAGSPQTTLPVYSVTSDAELSSPKTANHQHQNTLPNSVLGHETTPLPFVPPGSSYDGQLGSPNVRDKGTVVPHLPVPNSQDAETGEHSPNVTPGFPAPDDQSSSPNDQDSNCSDPDSDSESTSQDGSSSRTTIPYYPSPSDGYLGSPGGTPVSPDSVEGPASTTKPKGHGINSIPITLPPVVIPTSSTTSDNQLSSPNNENSDCSDPDSNSESTPQDVSASPTPDYSISSDGQLGSSNAGLDFLIPTAGSVTPTQSEKPVTPVPTVIPSHPSTSGQLSSPNVAPVSPDSAKRPALTTKPKGPSTNSVPVTPPASPESSDSLLGSPNNQDSDCSNSDLETSSTPQDGSTSPTSVPYNPSSLDGQLGSPNLGSMSTVPTIKPTTPIQPEKSVASAPTVVPSNPALSGDQLGSAKMTPVSSDPTTLSTVSTQTGEYPTIATPVTPSPTVVPNYPPSSSDQLGQPNIGNSPHDGFTPTATTSPTSEDSCDQNDTTTQPSFSLTPASISSSSHPKSSSGLLGQPNKPLLTSETIAPVPSTPMSPARFVTPSPSVASSYPMESSGQLSQPNSASTPSKTPSSVTPNKPTPPPAFVSTDQTGSIPVVTTVGTATSPAQPSSTPVDQTGAYSGQTPSEPTTFQTTSVEPTPPQISHGSTMTHPIHSTPSGYPSEDSDESLSQRPSTTSKHNHPSHKTPDEEDEEDDEDDEEDCCTCESCTEEDEIKTPQQFRTSACKDLEEARRELKAIFDKIKKKLKCGRRTSTTISSTSPL